MLQLRCNPKAGLSDSLLDAAHIPGAHPLPVQLVNPGYAGVNAWIGSAYLFQDSRLGCKQRNQGPPLVLIAEVLFPAVPNVVLWVQTTENAYYFHQKGFRLLPAGGGKDEHRVIDSKLQQILSPDVQRDFQRLVGIDGIQVRVVGGPAALLQLGPGFILQVGHELDLTAGPDVVLQLQLRMTRKEEGSRLQMTGSAIEIRFESAGHLLVHKVHAVLVKGGAAGQAGIVQIVKYADKNVGFHLGGLG